MLMEGTTRSAAALLMDIAAAPQWKYGVESAEIIKTNGAHNIWVRSVIAMPWPIADRDNINEMKLALNALDGTVTIEMVNRPELQAPVKKMVRMSVAEGRWILKPKDNGRVEITLEYMANPGGNIPDWVLSLFVLEGPIGTFQEMQNMLQKPKYRNAPPIAVGE